VTPHNPYRFQGQRLDFDLRTDKGTATGFYDETGRPDLTLYHFRARAYEARHGRFLQRDPLEFHDGMNPYEAFKGNPLRYLDPTGEGSEDMLAVQIIGDARFKSRRELRDFGWSALTDTILANARRIGNGDLAGADSNVLYEDQEALVIAVCKFGEPDYAILGQRVYLAAGATPDQASLVKEYVLFTTGKRAQDALLDARSRSDIERVLRVQAHVIRFAQDAVMGMVTGPALNAVFSMGAAAAGFGMAESGGETLLSIAARGTQGFAKTEQAVSLYEVGAYDALKSRSVIGDDIAIHHVPQGHPASQVISGYDYNTAPSIAIPTQGHQAIVPMRGPFSGGARDLLAKDLMDLRQMGGVPNKSLKELIRANAERYPGAFRKLPRE